MTSAQDEADFRNSRLTRPDIEWAVGPSGIYLRDKPGFNRWNTEAIERRHENERREWQRNQERCK